MGKKKGFKRGGDAAMWRFKACPKCGGDIFVDDDMNGWYEQCLQCGYTHDLKSRMEINELPPVRARELVLTGHNRRKLPN